MKLKLQIIGDGYGRIEVIFNAELLYRGSPLSPLATIQLLRNKLPILTLLQAKVIWYQREELNLKYD